MAQPDSRTDEELMADCAGGDLAAFETLLSRYERRLLSYAFRLSGDRELARDVYQQAFLKLFETRAQYRATAKFSTYVYRIVHNLCLNELRRSGHRRTFSMSSPASGAAGAAGDGSAEESGVAAWLADDTVGQPVEPLQRHEEDRLLHEAVEQLDPVYREVIALRIFEELSFAEISEITGAGESTVKSRMRYALMYLDRALRGRLRPKE